MRLFDTLYEGNFVVHYHNKFHTSSSDFSMCMRLNDKENYTHTHTHTHTHIDSMVLLSLLLFLQRGK
jgi:hypothetical protein